MFNGLANTNTAAKAAQYGKNRCDELIAGHTYAELGSASAYYQTKIYSEYETCIAEAMDYASCRTPGCGIESCNTCSHSACGITSCKPYSHSWCPECQTYSACSACGYNTSCSACQSQRMRYQAYKYQSAQLVKVVANCWKTTYSGWNCGSYGSTNRISGKCGGKDCYCISYSTFSANERSCTTPMGSVGECKDIQATCTAKALVPMGSATYTQCGDLDVPYLAEELGAESCTLSGCTKCGYNRCSSCPCQVTVPCRESPSSGCPVGGVESYATCRDTTSTCSYCGVESYKDCVNSACGVHTYKYSITTNYCSNYYYDRETLKYECNTYHYPS